MNSDNHHIPLKYICPLSGRLIKKPVKTSDGDIFDREAIEEWFKAGNVTNPISGQDLKNYDLFPEIVLREEIQDFRIKQTDATIEEQLIKLNLIKEKSKFINKNIKQFEYQWFKFQRRFNEFESKALERVNECDSTKQLQDGIYKGQMILDSINGIGIMQYKNGDKYLGQWKNGQIQGLGKKFIFMDNLYYFGEWEDGKLNGLGCVRPKNERLIVLYKGNWENDQRNGLGIAYDPYTKMTYKGEFRDNKRNGKGTQIVKFGDIYEGQWKDHLKHGKALRFQKDGNVVQEIWEQGKRVAQYEPRNNEEEQQKENKEEKKSDESQKCECCQSGCKLI